MSQSPPTIASPTIVNGLTQRKRSRDILIKTNDGELVYTPRKRPCITLEIKIPSLPGLPTDVDCDDPTTSHTSGLSSHDSLFDEPTLVGPPTSLTQPTVLPRTPALRTAPPIRGLFFTPTLHLPEEVAESVTRYCMETYFQSKGVNQVMLFGRLSSSQSHSPTGLPPILLDLLSTLEELLLPTLPPETHALLFPSVPSRARQAILNLYQPGEGITPHVDLLRRFGDGIIGVSLGSGCIMQFTEADDAKVRVGDVAGENEKKSWGIYLPERSVIVLSEDARYLWTHGIEKHTHDYVVSDAPLSSAIAGTWIERGVRLSITFRWLLPGAEVVGGE